MANSPFNPRLVRSDGREIILEDSFIIGRQADCDLSINDTLISRQHARFKVDEGKVIVTDLASHNGTFVNRQKITCPTDLYDGDEVRIGSNVFILRTTPPEMGETQSEIPLSESEGESETRMWQSGIPVALVRSDGAEFGVGGETSIGRAPVNNISLEKDGSASKQHARIELLEGRIVLTDLKSRNGTWVNNKRVTQPVLLKHGDRIRVGNTIFHLKVGDTPLPPLASSAPASPGASRKVWQTSAGIALGVTLLVILCVGISVGGFFGVRALFFPPAATLSPASEATQVFIAKQNALRAVVWIIVPDRDTDQTGLVSTGSGSLLNDQGYVLTNHHVLEQNIGEFYIGLNWNDPTAEPDTFYQCELVGSDARLDLAVLHVVALENGRPLPSDLVFPYLPVGDSDQVRIGDQVTIIGFPGIGGESPTLTSGSVSGFSADESNRLSVGWIKTDALISWGNSGGMAVNTAGELIGVPTRFTDESMEDKPLDTFIGLLRPINLALPLIQDYIQAP